MKFLKSFCAPFTVALFVVSTHASGASFDTPGDAFDTYGKVGKANVLSLTGSGDPSVGGRIHLEVDGGPANAFGAVAVSSFRTDAKGYGGTVYVDFTQAVFGFFITTPQGVGYVSQNVPAVSALDGVSVHMQAAVIDLSRPESVSLSTGLTVTFRG